MNGSISAARLVPISGALLAAAFASSCVTVPETGRKELMLISPQEEVQIGESEFAKMKQSTPICHDPAINAMVQRVGQRIAAVAPLLDARWEFVVFDDPKTVNAFCLPGGKVGVYTGILPITQDEGGLATVIGHEVSHAVARHGAERMSEGLLFDFGGKVLGVAMGKNSEAARDLALRAYGIGTEVGVALPHSRHDEAEADHLGLIYMARAGYDPHLAIEFWKRFAAYNAQHGGRRIEFLSTHPVDEKRIEQLEAELPQAMEEYRKAGGAPTSSE
jgi:predicted Zn-dependent protease